jgi:hypothetical protein
VQGVACVPDSIMCIFVRDTSNHPAWLIPHQTSALSSWRGSSWISLGFSALQYGLSLEFTSQRKEYPASSEKKHYMCFSFSIMYRYRSTKTIILTTESSLKAWTNVVLYGRSFNNFAALRAVVQRWIFSCEMLTVQTNEMIHGGSVLIANCREVCTELPACVVNFSRKSSRWSTLYLWICVLL